MYVEGIIPKIGCELSKSILNKLLEKKTLSIYKVKRSEKIAYYHNAPRYFVRATDFPPYFKSEREGGKLSTQIKLLYFQADTIKQLIVVILNSSLFYLWYIIRSDCRHLNTREVDAFPVPINSIQANDNSLFYELTEQLMEDYERNKSRKTAYYKKSGEVIYDEYFPKKSKHILDKIDFLLAKYYKFTESELDFIINYDIKYRMGNALFEKEIKA